MQERTDGTVPVTLFFDYNCPFCYVVNHRLEDLGERYPLDILWRFLEIHPNNPAEGCPVTELGYPEEQWQEMMRSLDELVAADALPFRPRDFTTNTRRALLLAQTVQIHRPGCFAPLHRALFHAYFADGRNIGDPEVLKALAREHGVDDLLQTAWETAVPLQVLLSHVEAAQELGLTGVPALVVSDRPFYGAVAPELLERALESGSSAV